MCDIEDVGIKVDVIDHRERDLLEGPKLESNQARRPLPIGELMATPLPINKMDSELNSTREEIEDRADRAHAQSWSAYVHPLNRIAKAVRFPRAAEVDSADKSVHVRATSEVVQVIIKCACVGHCVGMTSSESYNVQCGVPSEIG